MRAGPCQLGVEDYFIKDLLTQKELTAFLSTLALQSGYLRPERAPQRNTLDDALRLAAGDAPLIDTDWPVPAFAAASVFAVMVDGFETLLAGGEEAPAGKGFCVCVGYGMSGAVLPGRGHLLFSFSGGEEPFAAVLLYHGYRHRGRRTACRQKKRPALC